MTTPDGLIEELALERAAIAEHEQRADRFWQSRQYAHAQAEQRAARDARKRVRELEARIADAPVKGLGERAFLDNDNNGKVAR